MNRNKHFGKLVDEGISSVAKRQGKSIAVVEIEIAEELGYSQHTIQHWKRGNLPAQDDQVEFLVRYCAQRGRVDRSWAQSLLTHARYGAASALLDELFAAPLSAAPRLFLCYQRGSAPDESLALRVAQTLSPRYQVFFDQGSLAATNQTERLAQELHQADAVVIFVSDDAMRSELLLSQLELAHDLQQAQHGRPVLLPVRLPHTEPLTPVLAHVLGARRWSYWQDETDTPRLIQELEAALAGAALPLALAELPAALCQEAQPAAGLAAPRPAAQPSSLEMPEGTMSAESAFYIERSDDARALAAIARQGVTITIKGPRQVGKSSLLVRVHSAAARQGKRVALLDFQLLRPLLLDADAFFRQFAVLLSYALRMEDRTEEYWRLPLPNPFRCTEYVARYLVMALNEPLLLAMDEVDSVFESSFRTDFFGMLRAWHNSRAYDPAWKLVDLALVTSTEPYYFIDNLNQSPFNVGEVVELQPFTLEQVADLNRRHGLPLRPDQAAALALLVNGHPYLVRRALYLVASGRIAPSDLAGPATGDNGPFGDHLRSLLTRLYNKPELVAGLRQVLDTHSCPNDLFFRLRGAGLVRREQNRVVPSSPLYATFFQEHFGE